MSNIFIFTKNPRLLKKWKTALSDCHNLEFTTDIYDIPPNFSSMALVIIDVAFFVENIISFDYLQHVPNKILLVGENYDENAQIDAMAAGASGYCEYDAAESLLVKAVTSVLSGEIWLQRHLVPKVIGSLVTIPEPEKSKQKNSQQEQLIRDLSTRELDVAKMIGAGKTNKVIASSLDISERTVKAHLTSIYKKLDIPDRLHLAISISGFEAD